MSEDADWGLGSNGTFEPAGKMLDLQLKMRLEMKIILLVSIVIIFPVCCFAQADTVKSKLNNHHLKDVVIDMPAAKSIAKDTTICDKVYGTVFLAGSKTVQIFLGDNYPQEKFIIMIGPRSLGKFKNAPKSPISISVFVLQAL